MITEVAVQPSGWLPKLSNSRSTVWKHRMATASASTAPNRNPCRLFIHSPFDTVFDAQIGPTLKKTHELSPVLCGAPVYPARLRIEAKLCRSGTVAFF